MNFKKYSGPNKLLIILLISIYGVFSYWLLWPYKPVTVNGPLKVMNPNKLVCAGDYLIYKMDIVKHMPIAATIHKQLVNSFTISYSPIVGNMETGHKIFKVKLAVPVSAECGLYRLKWTGTYQVNPIRSVDVVAWSDVFKVN